jgi:hypothetical protein
MDDGPDVFLQEGTEGTEENLKYIASVSVSSVASCSISL